MFSERSNTKEKSISWRWLSSEGVTPNGIALIIMTFFIDIFIVIVAFYNTDFVFFIFLAIAVFFNILSVIYFFQMTELLISENYLSIKHGPVSLYKPMAIKLSDINDIEIIEKLEWRTQTSGSAFGGQGSTNEGIGIPLKVYKMAAIMPDNSRKILFHGPRRKKQAELLRKWIINIINEQESSQL